MTELLGFVLFWYLTLCLAAIWWGWQSGEVQRWRDEQDARIEAYRRAVWRRIHARYAAQRNPGPTIDAIERVNAERRRRANARIALRAMQARMAASDGR